MVFGRVGGSTIGLLMLAVPIATDLVAQPAGSPSGDSSVAVVRAYFAAYNAHDVPAVLALVDRAFVWLNITGDSVTLDVRGPEALEAGLAAYFEEFPPALSEAEALLSLVAVGHCTRAGVLDRPGTSPLAGGFVRL